MQRRLGTTDRPGSLWSVLLLVMVFMLPGRATAAGPPGLSPAPSCIDFEALMLAGKVPSVRLNAAVWSGSNAVRPKELTAVNTGDALDFPSLPGFYMLSVPARVGGVREALLHGGYIVNGTPDPYNAVPAGALVALVQKGAVVPVNVDLLYCGWAVPTIAFADRLRAADLAQVLWQFKAITAGPQAGAGEPVDAQEFRASLSRRLAEQALRLASSAPGGAVGPNRTFVADQAARDRPTPSARPTLETSATPGGKAEALPPMFMAGNTKVMGQFVREAGSTTYSGTGRVIWANGDTYEGTLVAGSREGKGKFVWANGQRFEGDWRGDRPNGEGAMWFINGDQYEGTIDDGVPNGQGRIRYGSGDRYEGQFRNAVAHGRGAYTWASGQRIEGDWVDGQGQGSANMRFANGDIYDGTVSGGAPNGRGRMIYASGDMYVGNLKNGLPDGEGTFLWKRGDQFKGQWKSGAKDGPGVMLWENGDRWQGTYRDDQQGEGTMSRVAK